MSACIPFSLFLFSFLLPFSLRSSFLSVDKSNFLFHFTTKTENSLSVGRLGVENEERVSEGERAEEIDYFAQQGVNQKPVATPR